LEPNKQKKGGSKGGREEGILILIFAGWLSYLSPTVYTYLKLSQRFESLGSSWVC
jgi:hypothetical protein